MMSQQSVEQLRFSFLAQKPVVVQSRPQPISGDAGLLPIRQFDHGWGYSQRLAACLIDRRDDPWHSHEQMVRQARCIYEDYIQRGTPGRRTAHGRVEERPLPGPPIV